MHREPCPKCREAGNDTAGDNLVVYDENNFHCFACGYNSGKSKKKPVGAIKLPEILVPTSIKKKGITAEDCRAWGICEEYVNERTGWVVLPFYKGKKLVGAKYRNFEAEKGKTKHVDYDGVLSFFGWHMRHSTHRSVFLWEGETDAITAWKYNKTFLHLGVPGAQSVEKLIREYALELRQFDKIYICFDNDDVGVQWRDKAVLLLPTYKTYICDMGVTDFKDINEAHLAGKGEETFKKIFESAYMVDDDTLITGESLLEHFHQRVTNNAHKGVGFDCGFPSLNEMMGGAFYRGEVCVLTGHTGTGKSTFARDLARNATLFNKDMKILWVGTEMYPSEMVQKFLEFELQKQIRWVDGKMNVDSDVLESTMKKLSEQFVFANRLTMDFDELKHMIILAVHQHDVGMVVVDVVCDITGYNDWTTASEILAGLVQVAQGDPQERRPPVAVLAICHTKGDETSSIAIDDIRGGSAIRQKATMIIALEGERSEQRRYLKVLKASRLHDSEVRHMMVEFDRTKRHYYEVDFDEEEEEEEDEKPRRKNRFRSIRK